MIRLGTLKGWRLLCAIAGLVLLFVAVRQIDHGSPASASVGNVHTEIWGDYNCDGLIGAPDLIGLLKTSAGVIPGDPICHDFSVTQTSVLIQPTGSLEFSGNWGDFNCSNDVNAGDTVPVLWTMGDLTPLQRLSCAGFGESVLVTEIPGFDHPGSIDGVGIDAIPTGNTANSLGVIDDCRDVTVGDTFDVDFYVRGVPPYHNYAGGLGAYDYTIAFDPGSLEVQGVDAHQMLAIGGNPVIVISDVNDGRIHIAAVTTGATAAHGDGVLARITFKAIGPGFSYVSFATSPFIPVDEVYDFDSHIYDIPPLGFTTAQIRSSYPFACGSPSPTPNTFTPTLTPTPVVTPPPSPTSSCANFGSPVAIPDADPDGVSDEKFVPESATITSMAMCLNIAHTWIGDLYITLLHNSQYTMYVLNQLLNGSGGCSGNGNGLYVLLTDGASQTIDDACVLTADLVGSFRSNPTFADAFPGDTTYGTWKLTVADEGNFNPNQPASGSWLGWQLFFNQ